MIYFNTVNFKGRERESQDGILIKNCIHHRKKYALPIQGNVLYMRNGITKV